MLGFFDNFFEEDDNWHKGVAAANTVACGYAFYRMYTNPETMWEDGFQLAGHGITLLSLGNRGVMRNLGAYSYNLLTLGALYAGMTSGASDRPLPANIASSILQVVNLGTHIFGAINSPRSSPTPQL